MASSTLIVARLALASSGALGRRMAAVVLATATLASAPKAADAEFTAQQRIASGLDQPVFVTHAPGDDSRLFIVERTGAIRILNLSTGTLLSTPFLSIAGVDSAGEGGLLGLAFHPDYAINGQFYTYSTHDNGGVDVGGATSPFSTHIRQYTVTELDPNRANTEFTPVLSFPRPQSNHVGGWIGFSPDDGLLYIASGDGGGSDDNDAGHTAGIGNAQDRTNLLGKMLRINIDDDDFPNNTPEGVANNYGIPASNPFVGVLGDDRIWSYGLRNPFRNSFDRETGDLWMGDVGQSTREEVNFEAVNTGGGNNYGWRLREGAVPTPTPESDPVGGAKPPGNEDPAYDYERAGLLGGITVIGGYVYRGPDPTLQGLYVFGDAGRFDDPDSVRLWTFDPDDPYDTVTYRNPQLVKDTGQGDRLASFGEDSLGNLYSVYVGSGEVYRLVTGATSAGDFDGDGRVDGDDLARWQSGFGTQTGAMRGNGDADGDADVDGADFLEWQRSVSAAPGSTTVAEPTALASLLAVVSSGGMGLVGSIRRQRKRCGTTRTLNGVPPGFCLRPPYVFVIVGGDADRPGSIVESNCEGRP